MKFLISLFAVTCFLNTIWSQVILDGTCSQFQVTDVRPFFRRPYMGLWYLYGVYDYTEIMGFDCITFFYQLEPNGNARATERSKNLATNTSQTTAQTIESLSIFDQRGTGHYLYQIPAEGNSTEAIQIISIDYIRYFIEFACVDKNGKSDCYVGIFTRLPIPNPMTVNRINRYLDTHHIDKTKIRYIIQDKTRCMY